MAGEIPTSNYYMLPNQLNGGVPTSMQMQAPRTPRVAAQPAAPPPPPQSSRISVQAANRVDIKI